jgi:hypothetical protein
LTKLKGENNMKVSLLNTSREVADGNKIMGNMHLEILTETDAERSFFRGLEKREKDIRVSVTPEGYTMQVYLKKEEKVK